MNLVERKCDVLVRNIDVLRAVMGHVKNAHPFAVVAMVVLPEHLHAIWRLPPGDANVVSGNGGIGNTKSRMEPIGRTMWITFITTRRNMAWSRGLSIGHNQRCTATFIGRW